MEREGLIEECMNYNPDVELYGSGNSDYGHSLAERLIKGFPGANNFSLISNEISEEKWGEFYSIIENSNPKKIYHEPGTRKKLRGVLGKLKKSGAKVRDYTKMRTSEMWNYFCEVRKEVYSHVI